jgi:protein-tyrosine phosphatase
VSRGYGSGFGSALVQSATIEAVRVLVVCTANICRSPMLEALIARRLAREGINAMVRSVGVHAFDGAPPLPEVVTVMREFGIDVSAHASQRVTPELVQGADLVIGLAREHVRETVVLDPGSFGRSFTIKELVRRTRSAGPRPAAVQLGAWLESLVAEREVDELLGASSEDDVEDPVGRPVAAVRTTASELAGLTDAVVSSVWPSVDGRRAMAPETRG